MRKLPTGISKCKFKFPNEVIRKIYAEYFLSYISKKAEIQTDNIDTESINEEILERGEVTERYKKTEEIKAIPKLRNYTVVAVKNKLIVEEI